MPGKPKSCVDQTTTGMEKPCGNEACSNTFISHNNRKKYCSRQCYTSAAARGSQAKIAQRTTAPAYRVPPVHLTAPTRNYVESPDGTRAPRGRDGSWAPSPSRSSSPILEGDGNLGGGTQTSQALPLTRCHYHQMPLRHRSFLIILYHLLLTIALKEEVSFLMTRLL